jgi:hypothetical protein
MTLLVNLFKVVVSVVNLMERLGSMVYVHIFGTFDLSTALISIIVPALYLGPDRVSKFIDYHIFRLYMELILLGGCRLIDKLMLTSPINCNELI